MTGTRDLDGVVAVVTGAGRGFGRSVAESLAGAGAHLGLVARSGDEVEGTAGAIRDRGGSASAFALDVADGRAVKAMLSAFQRDAGPVSVLVNNAGTLDAIGPFWEIDPDAWWREVEVHVRGTVLFSHAVLAGMVAREAGRIINIGGMLGQQGEPYSTAYTCAKAAMYRLTECLAAELQGSGVRLFCVSPGPVRTRMTASLVTSEEGCRWFPEFAAMSNDEWFPPEMGAELVLRLARGDADELSGRALHVTHDLDALVADAGAISSGGRLVLRVTQ